MRGKAKHSGVDRPDIRDSRAGNYALAKSYIASQGHCTSTQTVRRLTTKITAIITLKFVSGNAIDTRGKHTTDCGGLASAEVRKCSGHVGTSCGSPLRIRDFYEFYSRKRGECYASNSLKVVLRFFEQRNMLTFYCKYFNWNIVSMGIFLNKFSTKFNLKKIFSYKFLWTLKIYNFYSMKLCSNSQYVQY